mgnify:CR=1 FL=1
MKMWTTADLIRQLQQQDPDGTRIVKIRVFDEDDDKENIAAFGELDGRTSISLKDAEATSEGDKRIVRIDIPLTFNDMIELIPEPFNEYREWDASITYHPGDKFLLNGHVCTVGDKVPSDT